MAGAHAGGQGHPRKTDRDPSSTGTAGQTMIVLDASVVVELLINSLLGDTIRAELLKSNESFLVPHLIDIEVVSALRSLTLGERVDAHRSGQFLASLASLPAERYSHTPLLG